MAVGEATAGALGVRLAVETPAIAGRAALVRVEVANSGPAPVTASRRLNLMEGDLRLIVAEPSGARRTAPGWQLDTGLDRVELAPGFVMVGAINLLDVGDGPLFRAPGRHLLAADYFPSPLTEPVAAPEVPVTVRGAESAEDRALADLLGDEATRQALLFAEADGAPEALRRLADGFPTSLEGVLAGLVLSAGASREADWAAAEAALGPVRLALAVLALATPRSGAGRQLASSLAAWLERRGGAGGGMSEALAIVRRDLLPA